MENVQLTEFFAKEVDRSLDGKHVWVAIMSFDVKDPTQSVQMFDEDNMMSFHIGCYWCEEVYKPGKEKTRCAGES